ncbi:hypothetical protein BU17DRAFT_87118 [Hysterangium stoloniferum]|nr:hypothetical protein BU17DRAFT_87118 [Hysterangium stoloniferum]
MTNARPITPPSQPDSLNYYPYLREDLQNCATIELEEFLEIVLGFKIDAEAGAKARKICDRTEFKKRMDKYCEVVADETGRYAPFVELVNYIFYQIGMEEIQLCRNDRTPLWGSYAAQKGPGDVDAFHWGEALDFWEFKLVVKSYVEYLKSTAFKSSCEKQARSNELIPAKTSSSNLQPKNLLVPTRRSTRPNTIKDTQKTDEAVEVYTSESQKKRSSSSNSEQTSKRAKTDSDIDNTDLQCASYALEMFSNGNLLNHIISSLITDFKIQLLYYDHALNARSQALDFITDRTKFVGMLIGYSRLDRRGRGLATEVTPEFISPLLEGDRLARRPFTRLFVGQKIQLADRGTVTLQATIFRQHALIGRGTSVFRVDVSWMSSVAVLKVSWPSQKRTPESVYINHAHRIASSDSEHKWVRKHLPIILYFGSFPPDEKDAHYRMVIFLNSKEPNKYELRELRVLLQTELFPITELKDARQVKDVFHQILKCHRWLYTEPKILHRDIRLGNLMFRREKDEIFGVLNDFNMACYVDGTENHPELKQQTGTRPFMSIDLMDPSSPVKHLYRHDLELIFYVSMFFTARYQNGTEIHNPPLEEWFTLGGNSLRAKKVLFISASLPTLTPQFTSLKWHLVSMCQAILRGHTDCADHEHGIEKLQAGLPVPSFDHETLNGHLTFQVFDDIFNTEL